MALYAGSAPLREPLGSVFRRRRDPRQSTDFSFSRFLVPWLCVCKGWALFVDADLLCLADIAELRDPRDDRHAVQVVKPEHRCAPGRKVQGELQAPCARKNWSSGMWINGARCRALTPGRIQTASGLHLHQFAWLADGEIGALPPQSTFWRGLRP